MVKKRKSDKRVAMEREDGHKLIEEKIIKKEEKKLEEGMIAREDALKAAGIKQEYNYADHQHIYNYADDGAGAPIESIGYKIVKCKRCSFLKDGDLPEEQQCRCDWTARGWRSPPPSPLPSPKLSLKRASPCPAMQETVPGNLAGDGPRGKRARKIFEAVMAAGARK